MSFAINSKRFAASVFTPVASTFVGVSNIGPGASGGHVNFTWPTGTAAGDIVFVMVCGSNNPAVYGIGMSGVWSYFDMLSNQNHIARVFYKVLDATNISETPYVSRPGPGGYIVGYVATYRGGTNVVVRSAANDAANNSVTVNTSGFAKDYTESAIISLACWSIPGSTGPTITPPSGFGGHTNFTDTTLTGDGFGVADKLSSYAGGTISWTEAVAGSIGMAVQNVEIY